MYNLVNDRTCMSQAFESCIAKVPTPPDPPNIKILLFLLMADTDL